MNKFLRILKIDITRSIFKKRILWRKNSILKYRIDLPVPPSAIWRTVSRVVSLPHRNGFIVPKAKSSQARTPVRSVRRFRRLTLADTFKSWKNIYYLLSHYTCLLFSSFCVSTLINIWFRNCNSVKEQKFFNFYSIFRN